MSSRSRTRPRPTPSPSPASRPRHPTRRSPSSAASSRSSAARATGSPNAQRRELTLGADGVWRGDFTVPAGSWEYKVALNDTWDVNYGAGAVSNGANIALTLAAETAVRFYFDGTTHWVTSNRNATIATAAGSFQSEIGCPGDWAPGLPPLVAPGHRRRRRLHLRHGRHPDRRLRVQGRPRRGAGRRPTRPPTCRSPSRPATPSRSPTPRRPTRSRSTSATSRPIPRTRRSPCTRCATT